MLLSNLGFLRAVGRARRKHFRRLAFRAPQSHLGYKKKIRTTAVSVMPSAAGVVLKAAQFGIVRHSELVAMHKIIRRKLDRKGSLLIYTLPFVSVTAKGLAVRMGKGKGAISSWVIPCAPGKLIFRIYGVPEEVGKNALRAAARKLNFETIVTTFLIRCPKKGFFDYYYQWWKRLVLAPCFPDFFSHHTDMIAREQDSLRKFKRKRQASFSTSISTKKL